MGTSELSITLANSIIGVGILAMPFCFQQCGVVLATLLLLLMGLVSRLSCYFLLKSALLARRRNYEFLALHVFGPAGKFAVEVGIIGFLMGTCVAYFVVVGDLGPQIISKVFEIDQSDTLRTSVMVIVTIVCVLPLGLLRNVDSLSNVSAATIGFYFCLVIKVISEAATQMLTTDWSSRLALWRPAGVLQCTPIFAMALFCQTQLFEIFETMPSLSLEKMSLVTKNAINICAAVYFTLGLFGYIAFSTQTISGNILLSLSPTMASDVIKLGFVLSLAFSFPLLIFPCRASLYSFLYKKGHSHSSEPYALSMPEWARRRLTLGVTVGALLLALAAGRVERVLGLLGAGAGAAVCLVLPAAAYARLQPRHAGLAKCILVLGLVIMVLGTYANLRPDDQPKVYDKQSTQDKIDKIVEDFFEGRKGKDDGAVSKPLFNAPPPVEPQLPIESNPEIIKDSEVQPPNPVPPEAQPQPVEKIAQKPNLREALNEMKKEIENMKKKEDLSESHPKNVKGKLENLSLAKIEEEKIKELDEDKAKSDKAEEIIETKQKELIETIKQHDEEQKELMKEQKEIINEMKKTKEEIEQNKKEVVDIEAKKLAVEKIQQIANIAIQSLSAGAEVQADSKMADKDKPFEKIANKAVEEIAKKAVESIVAINKIEEVKDAQINEKPAQNISLSQLVEQHAKPNVDSVPQRVENNQKVEKNIDKIKQEDTAKVESPKEHSHSPDEPQSYKQGEDELEKLNRNIPIAVALNGNSIKAEAKPDIQNADSDHLRQKRDTVNGICDDKDLNSEILPKVDLNDLLARNGMETAVQGRSLKSIDDNESF